MASDDVQIKATLDTTGIEQGVNKINSTLGKAKFAGYALSIMFFGQALERVFNSITSSAIKTFEDVAHSVMYAVTNFDLLNGSIAYLQYGIGAALEPIAGQLIPIINAMADWVNQNPQLVSSLLLVIGALGIILSVGGAAKLAFDGLVTTFGVLSAAFEPIIAAGGAVLALFGTAGLLAVFAALALVAAAIWISWSGLVTGFKQIFKGVIEFFQGLFSGDFNKIFQGLIDIVSGALKIIIDLFLALGAVIIDVFIFAINFITSAFFNLIKIIVGGIRAIIDLANSTGLVHISTEGLDTALNTLESWKQSLQIGYITKDQIGNAISTINDMRIFNINIDKSSDPAVAQAIISEVQRNTTG
jgi:hypothetical protein